MVDMLLARAEKKVADLEMSSGRICCSSGLYEKIVKELSCVCCI